MSTIVLMAGGTGGHLFPAMALAQELRRRDHIVHLMTDERVTDYGSKFPARNIYVVPAATPSIRNPLKLLRAAVTILGGVLVALRYLNKIQPDAVVGFGGYPVFPPFLAARLRRIPGVLHEQNSVLGRANKALAKFTDVLALSFRATRYAEPFADKCRLTGNPVRDNVREMAAQTDYSKPTPNGQIRVLVFGGSQGARVFSDIVPHAIALLPAAMRKRLVITQQCRPEDIDRVADTYRAAKVNVELSAFFDDMPKRMASAHLVISRSGASTIAELAVMGRPAILVPLPGALDADQKNNAAILQANGGGWLMDQASLSPQSLATRVEGIFKAPDMLSEAAGAARKLGQPDAVKHLADLVEDLASGQNRIEKDHHV